jgi:hypothetical protein
MIKMIVNIIDIQLIVIESMSYLKSHSTYTCVEYILKMIVFVQKTLFVFPSLISLNNYIALTMCHVQIYVLPMR